MFFVVGRTAQNMKKTFLIFAALLICGSTFAQDFESGRSDFLNYRASKIREINFKTNGYRLPSAPFALLHEGRTKNSALLIHGLNDSPYYLKDIAKTLFEQGYNVITVLLGGHGLNLEDMKEVSYLDWLNEVRWGLRIAGLLGENVTVGGFSAGGLLAVSASLEFSQIKNLLLFAPALKVKSVAGLGNRTAKLTCMGVLNQISYDSAVGDSPVKYGTRSVNGACQVMNLINHLYNQVGRDIFFYDADHVLLEIGSLIKIPTYLAVTTSDLRVNTRSLIEFGRALRGEKSVLVFTPKAPKVYPYLGLKILEGYDIEHGALALETNQYNNQKNHGFFHIRNSLKKFLSR